MAKIAYKKIPGKLVATAALVALLGTSAAYLSLEKITEFEGYVEEAYQDPVGIWTICFGDIENVKPGQKENFDQCLRRLNNQIVIHAKPILKCVPSLQKQNPKVIAAMVSMAYNIGPSGFCKSTVAEYANQGNYEKACKRIAEIYRKAGGKELKGLVNRRKSESELCLQGLKEGYEDTFKDLFTE